MAVLAAVQAVRGGHFGQAGDGQDRGEQRRGDQLDPGRVAEQRGQAGAVQVLDRGQVDDQGAVTGSGLGQGGPEALALLMSISPATVRTQVPSGRWWVDMVSGVVMG